MSHVFPPGGEMKLSEAVARYQKWQEDEGASKAYLVDLKWRLNRLVKKLPATIQLPEITWLMLDPYLSRLKLNPVGRQNEIRNIRPFFNWAIDLKLIASNPIPSRALATRKKDRTRTQVIHILSVEQAKLLLENAGPSSPTLSSASSVVPARTKPKPFSGKTSIGRKNASPSTAETAPPTTGERCRFQKMLCFGWNHTAKRSA